MCFWIGQTLHRPKSEQIIDASETKLAKYCWQNTKRFFSCPVVNYGSLAFDRNIRPAAATTPIWHLTCTSPWDGRLARVLKTDLRWALQKWRLWKASINLSHFWDTDIFFYCTRSFLFGGRKINPQMQRRAFGLISWAITSNTLLMQLSFQMHWTSWWFTSRVGWGN